MKCFKHPQSDSFGVCKFCLKGVCSECADDTGVGLACSAECREQVMALKAMMARSTQAFPLAARSHTRNAVLLGLFGAVFAVISALSYSDFYMFMLLFSIAVVMFVGSLFSFLNARKYSKLSRPQK